MRQSVCLKVHTLEQCFADWNMITSHLGELVKKSFLFQLSRVGPEILPLGVTDPAGLWATFRVARLLRINPAPIK